MTVGSILIAAVALSIERICYAWVWHYPDIFRRFCGKPAVAWLGEPVDVLKNLFICFKGLQLSVFIGWCYFYGNGSLLPAGEEGVWLALGSVLIAVGQVLNAGVFLQLGKIGVFYGNKLGYDVPWCQGFPFSLLDHPQYVGSALSVWGFFMTTRFPQDDWYVLPVLQTSYYIAGSYLEQ
jgi:methylene-fatty-acyl-phospholipid synthase